MICMHFIALAAALAGTDCHGGIDSVGDGSRASARTQGRWGGRAAARLGRGAAARGRGTLIPAMADDDEPLPPSASKGPIVVLWTIQTSCILLTSIACGYALISLKFLLVPLLMAYFVIFLMAPILDIMEKRPLKACFGELPPEEEQTIYEKTYQSKMLCVAGYENERRKAIVQQLNARTPAQQKVATPLDGQLAMAELTLMAQIPHALASVLTLAVCCIILGICGSVRSPHRFSLVSRI